MPILPDQYHCTGCFSCVDACPQNALNTIVNTEGHFIYSIEKEKCVECHRCEKVCPINKDSFIYGSNDLTMSLPYAAWCLDQELRHDSTSGGVFAALAKKTLDDGGAVIGATLQNNKIRHVFIDKLSDLTKLQGSKYAQSNTKGIYLQTLQQLKKGKTVLFSGTGCQVAGLLSFLPSSLETSNLITVDLVCGGVPSNFLIDTYLSYNNETVKEISGFRNKEKYEFSVVDKGGEKKVVPITARPLPLCGFYTEMTNRYSCYDCQFAYAHRKADLTIGDLWGDKRYTEQHIKGISLVIVHSQKGKKATEESELEIHEVEWKDVLPYNPRIAYGKNLLVRTRERKRLSVAFKEDSFQQLLDDYANDASFKRPWSVIKKLYRVILITINHRIAVAHINRLLKG